MPPQQQTTQAIKIQLPLGKAKVSPSMSGQKQVMLSAGRTKGKVRGGYKKGVVQSSQPDWFMTLLGCRGAWPPSSLRFKHHHTGQAMLHLVLLDTSASTLSDQVFGKAKGVLLEIARKAYLKREQLAVFGFGNGRVSPLLARKRAPKQLLTWLGSLSAGGGTPLLQGITEVANYLKKLQKQLPDLVSHTYLLTDGRTSQDLSGCYISGACTVVDVEQSTVKRGRGRELAAVLEAEYVRV